MSRLEKWTQKPRDSLDTRGPTLRTRNAVVRVVTTFPLNNHQGEKGGHTRFEELGQSTGSEAGKKQFAKSFLSPHSVVSLVTGLSQGGSHSQWLGW